MMNIPGWWCNVPILKNDGVKVNGFRMTSHMWNGFFFVMFESTNQINSQHEWGSGFRSITVKFTLFSLELTITTGMSPWNGSRVHLGRSPRSMQYHLLLYDQGIQRTNWKGKKNDVTVTRFTLPVPLSGGLKEFTNIMSQAPRHQSASATNLMKGDIGQKAIHCCSWDLGLVREKTETDYRSICENPNRFRHNSGWFIVFDHVWQPKKR